MKNEKINKGLKNSKIIERVIPVVSRINYNKINNQNNQLSDQDMMKPLIYVIVYFTAQCNKQLNT